MVETMIDKPVKERPMLLTLDMARAWNLGFKTNTRRLNGLDKINLDPHNWFYRGTTLTGDHIFGTEWSKDETFDVDAVALPCPFGKPGDRLWPREPWKALQSWDHAKPSELPIGSPIEYLAGGKNVGGLKKLTHPGRYRHARFMCRWMSRNLSEIVSVRAERLQDITEEDAVKEGVRLMRDGGGTFVGHEGPGRLVTPWPTAKEAFADLWESINGPDSWDSNPWVWRVEFKRIEA